MRRNLLWIPLGIMIIFSLFSVNMIRITVAQADHDIAVASVTPSPTSVRLGELVNITVVVENQGTENETFDLTVYYDTATVETRASIILEAGLNTSLTFTWNTTDVKEEIYATKNKEKTYTINATATIALDEDPDDNTLVSPSTVKVISHYIAVVPQSIVDPNLTPGKNFTVSIYTDYNGSDVWMYQFTLNYNPSVLHGVEVTNGDLITEDKAPSAQFTLGEFDNNAGELSLTLAFFYYMRGVSGFWPANITSGPGTLANVTFEVVGTGDSDITLGSDAKLFGFTEGGYGDVYEIVSDYKPDIRHILPGYFRNTAAEVTHDVAILNVTFSNTTVPEGYLVNITVVVENQGTVAETFTVTTYYDNITPNYRIATTKTVQNLGAGASTSLTFVWNTMGVTAGSHTIWAEAGTVPGETDTADNKLRSEGMVEVEVSAGVFQTELIIGIVVVVILIGVAAYVIMRVRRKKPSPSLSSSPSARAREMVEYL